MYGRAAQRYKADSWEPEKPVGGDTWLPGETSLRAVRPQVAETFASLPVELTLDNERGDRVGLVVRTADERCVVLVRGSILVSTRWPRRTEDFVKVARFLVLSELPSDKLPMLEEAAEFDPFGAFVLEEAAADVGEGSRMSTEGRGP